MYTQYISYDWLNHWPVAIDSTASLSPLSPQSRGEMESSCPLIIWLVLLQPAPTVRWDHNVNSHGVFSGTEDRKLNINFIVLTTQEIPMVGELWARNCFPGGSAGKNLPAMRETWVLSLGWEDPLEREQTMDQDQIYVKKTHLVIWMTKYTDLFLDKYTVGPPYSYVLHLWVQEVDCIFYTLPFYIRNLIICGFWYRGTMLCFSYKSQYHTELCWDYTRLICIIEICILRI